MCRSHVQVTNSQGRTGANVLSMCTSLLILESRGSDSKFECPVWSFCECWLVRRKLGTGVILKMDLGLSVSESA
jgi:hypothetical protein